MLKKFSTASLILALVFCLGNAAQAQRSDYSTGLGIRAEFGSGIGDYFGFSAKHFFSSQGAGEAHLLFGSAATMLGLEYQHHFDIASAAGLKWYVGIGPGFLFGKNGGGTSVLLRPLAGLEYTLSAAPVNFGFDWRPAAVLSNGSGFEAGRFGLAVRYVF